MKCRTFSSILVSLLIAAILTPLFAIAGGPVYVRGYTKKDGTYVAPHYRSAPDKSISNNWSTKGNVNPYTGAPGTRATPPNVRKGRYGGPVPSYYDAQTGSTMAPTFFGTPNPSSTGTYEISEATQATTASPAENAIKLGVEALQNGNKESAFANFSEAVRLDPKSPNAFLARALAFGLKSEWDNALADCTEAIRLDPHNAFLGYFCRGDVYMKKHDHDKAIADYTKAIQLNPNNAGVYDSRGTAYEKKGEKSKAEADFEKAKSLTVKPQVAADAKWQVAKKPSAMQPAPRKKIYVPQGLDSNYVNTGDGHWIQKNIDGEFIVLEDNSFWKIDPLDTVDAYLWLNLSEITVIKSDDGSLGYDYLLVNTDDGEKAHAKYVGQK